MSIAPLFSRYLLAFRRSQLHPKLHSRKWNDANKQARAQRFAF